METLEILKIILPALFVLLTAYLMIDKLLRNEEKRRNFELRRNNLSTITPIRLRAYERLILVLERTTPHKLILNVAKPEMTNVQLHTELLASIRQEFNHNLSQQIYVSDEVWSAIAGTQESLLQLVNSCTVKCDPTAPASSLAEMIIQVYVNTENTPTEITIKKLKDEVRAFL
jgi:hypothetical protein